LGAPPKGTKSNVVVTQLPGAVAAATTHTWKFDVAKENAPWKIGAPGADGMDVSEPKKV
jgi:hypothetical protein